MPRLARIVIPDIPHHITQRGNRRMQVFFSNIDYQYYIDLIGYFCSRHSVKIWAYCLMPNHVHLIAVPSTENSLRLAFGEAHRRYTRYINQREEWRGHLWQERFSSFPMDERHLLSAARYVELNPVRAKLVRKPEDWHWSSAKAHLEGKDDNLVIVKPILDFIDDWDSFLDEKLDVLELDLIRTHIRTGRPLGGKDFIENLEKKLKRTLMKKRAGRKKK
ncbi:MAG: transposase [Candidatus Hatepunaea meridiana]|nr:transposase [Candidatus Hatepunaea meridiana]